MATVKRFEDLECWKASQELIIAIYEICKKEQIRKDHSLSDQIKRASVSVSNNIVEGFERISRKEFKRFLSIANGSCSEVKNMIYVMKNLSFINKEEFNELMDICQKTQNLIKGLMKYLYSLQQNK